MYIQIYIHAVLMEENRAMNLKDSGVGYIGGFGDWKRKGEIFN